MYVPVQEFPALPMGSVTGADAGADAGPDCAALGTPGIPVQPEDSRSTHKNTTKITLASLFI
jgi:hypothetical protein